MYIKQVYSAVSIHQKTFKINFTNTFFEVQMSELTAKDLESLIIIVYIFLSDGDIKKHHYSLVTDI